MKKDEMWRLQRDASEEHGHLRKLCQQASDYLSRRQATRVKLTETLVQLRHELLDHFQQEELGGYFREVINIAPRLKGRADALRAQHLDLKARLDRLQSLAQQDEQTESWWQEMIAEFGGFLREFDEHERGETALLQEAYTRDIGTDD
jgi:iron-sulfur cluster repair protein YtfE (RIC family)